MKKISYLNVYAILIIWIFYSCEKNKDNNNKYSFSSFDLGEVRLFSTSGEILDQNTIDRFATSWKNFYLSEEDAVSWITEIELLSDNEAIIKFRNDTAKVFKITRKNEILYFEDSDTLTVNDTTILDNKFKYHPLFSDLFTSSENIRLTYVPCIYAIENTNEIYVPIICYFEEIYLSNGFFESIYGIWNFNNEFNSEYLFWLQNSTDLIDTLLLQNSRIVFTKN